jgi:hypothetical protein
VADWVTISSLATAGGTLVLAAATYSSVRSANRSARVAERTLMAGLRPLLMPSRPDDPPQKVGFADGRWLMVPGGRGAAEATPDALYLAMSLRNVGAGIAVLHGWRFTPELRRSASEPRPTLDEFHRLTRDLYVPVGDIGFWQGVFRSADSAEFEVVDTVIRTGAPFMVDVLYSDHEGGQRVVSRYALTPAEDGWRASAGRHWNIDRDDPR